MRRFRNCLILAGLAAAAVLLIASCDSARISGDGGYLGNTFDFSSTSAIIEKDGSSKSGIQTGFFEFRSSETDFDEMVPVVDGAFSIDIGIPDSGDMGLWVASYRPSPRTGHQRPDGGRSGSERLGVRSTKQMT